jgi:hypothetical protein
VFNRIAYGFITAVESGRWSPRDHCALLRSVHDRARMPASGALIPPAYARITSDEIDWRTLLM